jgi:cytochrome b
MKNPAAANEEHRSEEVRIWDPLVRYGHWVLAVAFLVAYVTEDDLLTVHVWAGYVVGVVILVRIVWGLIGTQHARFRDFMYSPRESLAYLFDMLRGRAKRHLGHSPTGAPMVFALLISLALTTGSGLLVYAYDKHAGPLAGMVAADVSESVEDFWEETHEVLANLTLLLVVLHIAGVGLASFSHKENLVRAMVTGKKRTQT